MRNINFKSFFISFITAFFIAFSFTSCKEESPTRAIITVVDPNGAPAYDVCTVILSQQGLINSAGNESNVYESKKTSSNGTFEFEFVSKVIHRVSKLIGVKKNAQLHPPQTNGLCERMNRTILHMLE